MNITKGEDHERTKLNQIRRTFTQGFPEKSRTDCRRDSFILPRFSRRLRRHEHLNSRIFRHTRCQYNLFYAYSDYEYGYFRHVGDHIADIGDNNCACDNQHHRSHDNSSGHNHGC